ncbi:MAG: hypothetical protein O7C56_06490, partial [Rickettsia endosymbiont of Ixodes persulcatus]|nr:hypothetical protein [Rickettsia endosymbiont of Ixodes persulcatus]
MCKDNGVDILRGKVASNHVHIYVSVQPFTQTARELGITKSSLYNWVHKYLKPKEVMRDDEHLYDELKRFFACFENKFFDKTLPQKVNHLALQMQGLRLRHQCLSYSCFQLE